MGDYSTNLNFYNGLVTFCINDNLYCANIDDIFAIVNPAFYPKNFVNSELIGSHLSTEDFTISVIDLHSLFGFKKNKITSSSRYICFEIHGKTFGFLADKVEEVITLNPTSRKDFDFTETENEKFIAGKVKYRDEEFYLPNFNEIINESFIHH